ncbi:MAG: rane-bound lytic murein transglycosylase [Thermodesulfobacteriota bacterium]|nr:rane-bound lytic murein transglycosylase [Thermodesulfobacteriota bacterium]
MDTPRNQVTSTEEGGLEPVEFVNETHAGLFRPLRFWGWILLMLLSTLMLGETDVLAQARKTPGFGKGTYVFPPGIQKQGLTFCNEKIPFDRRDVSGRVLDQLNFLLMDRRAGLMEWSDRMSIWGPSIDKVLMQEKVPKDLIYLSVLVSDLSPHARLKNGGVGWWGIGGTRDKKGLPRASWVSTENWDDRRDPVLSTRIVCSIFKGILEQTPGRNWLMAISSYLDGQDKISAIVNKSPGFSYWDLVMPPLSDLHIPRLVALKIIDNNRDFYSVAVPPLKPASYDVLDQLVLLKDLPLHVVARWLRISPRSLWELNPGVDISNGVLPKANSKGLENVLLRVPLGKGEEIRALLVKDAYLGARLTQSNRL